ncbi:MAG: SDR family NAD(P)-dependent oxidoreductase [Acidimicrobiia bacterium]|nr:SDR family NAD(P)-dependent oxidoreductase [Acidimicrobiia bacterium]
MFVVTGASSGIGRAVTVALAERDQSVLAVARDSNRLSQLAVQFSRVTALASDLLTTEGVRQVVDACAAHGSLAGIVHAAGTLIEPQAFGAIDTGVLLDEMRVHVMAPIELNQRLRAQLSRIVFLDSYSSNDLRVGWAAYSIVKAAAQMAARSAAEELRDVQVIRAFPGAVRTPLVDAVLNSPADSPTRRTFRALQSTGKLHPPDEIGEWIARLLLDTSDEELAARPTWQYGESF